MLEGTRLCSVCQKAEFRYTCPRCEAVYCGLPCYQAHSESCTERFYQAQVEGGLRDTKVTEDERKRLEGILRELHSFGEEREGPEEEPEDEEGAAEARLEALAERARHDELCIEDLTDEEIRCFHSELKRGTLGRLLSPWEPWWRKAVLESPASPPPVHICCSAERPAHPSVALTVVETVFAYCHTLRAFNGEWEWDPQAVAAQLLHVAQAVASHRVHANADDCLREAIESASVPRGTGPGEGEFHLLCVEDAAVTLGKGRDFAARALLEAEAVVRAAAAAAQSGPSPGKKAASGLRRCCKKLEFLASFVWHHEEELGPLGTRTLRFAEVEAERARVLTAAKTRPGEVVAPPKKSDGIDGLD